MVSMAPEDRPAGAAEALAALTATSAPPAVAGPSRVTRDAPTIGPWALGDQVSSDPNWRVFAVSHARTGAAARLAQLQPAGPLGAYRELILGSAARASRLDHPGLVPVIDWGVKDELAYVVTRAYGQTLWNLVKSGGPLDETEALEIVATLADVLAFLHGRGLVYQCVDPGGAQIGPDARSVHLAWPVYCVEAGTPVVDPDGKRQRAFVPQWAAPEAARKEGVITPSVDIYGLGEILYYCLAGVAAYGGDSRAGAIMLAKLGEPPDLRERRPDVTGPTARLVAELLNPNPARRPPSAAAARDELAGIARRLRGG
jgi:serine/threonine protein kinase